MHPGNPDSSDTQSGPTQPWFVAQLKPNAAAMALRNLRQQGFECFAPFEEVAPRHARKLARLRRPLFPGYLFVSFDPANTRWRAINSTLGISRLVSFAKDTPAQAPAGLIDSLKQRCDASGKLLPPRFLRDGDVVRVTNGPFAEFIGTVEQLAPDRRIWILLDILGKSTRVALKHEDLRLTGRWV